MKAVWAKGLLEEKNIHIIYKYTFTPEANTHIDIAASNLYRIFINGKFVGYGPARAAHGYSRLDTYDLSTWAGTSAVIAIEVYSANVNTFYTVDELPFFACEIRNGEELVAEATDFTAYHFKGRVQKVCRFSYQRTFSESYVLDENPMDFFASAQVDAKPIETELVNMNKLLPRYVSYPDLKKLNAEKIEHGELSIDMDAEIWIDRSYTLVDNKEYKGFLPEEISDNANVDVSRFKYAAKDGAFPDKLSDMSYRTYDFGRTVTGFFSLDVTVERPTQMYITFEEVVTQQGNHKAITPFRNGCCNIVKYKLAPGKYNLINFEANSARYAVVSVTEGCASVDNFGMVVYENPDAGKYEYDYKDDELNAIVAAAVETFAQNAVDVLTDCPSRERAGWLCDAYFSSRSEKLFTGDNRVEKSFLENYAMCPKLAGLPDGMIPMNYPADVYSGLHIPNWSMWYIIELNEYVKRTGDERMREISRDKVMGLVKFFEKYENTDGLLEDLENWVFVEWSKCNDADYVCGVNYPSNMLWAQTLCAVAELYDMPELVDKASKMREVIREKAWNGMFFEDNAVRDADGNLVKTGHTTETCQYYAFFFGVATPDTHAELFERMLNEFGPERDDEKVWPQVYRSNAFIGNYLRLEIMLRYGYHSRVLRDCRAFFTGMAQLTGTLWEHSRIGTDASLNHGFASVAAVYIDECVRALNK